MGVMSSHNEKRELNAAELDRIWRNVYDSPAWCVKQGHGSFLTLEFGQPELVIREPTQAPLGAPAKMKARCARRLVTVTGDWHLWIYCCNWRITLNGALAAHNESPDGKIAFAASCLDGQKLVAVHRDSRPGSWLFTFDLGGTLQTWPYGEDPTVEQWYLFERKSGNVLSVRADDHVSYGSGSETPEKTVWVPL
jgi:hypothetical protein